ncbi:hypothetical protein LCGC14_3021170 [marine sediment metagenome]|uniref:YkgJ family cysteine cluster protein n=1 Tax=marine sediment metagenome TaxID=412755 RepID=A0A0F8WVA8_9ZZZZ
MEMVEVKVSSKWARHLFACSPDFIREQCHGRCCEGVKDLKISLTPEEAVRETAKGNMVINGLLRGDPATGKCPYKNSPNGFCFLHGKAHKFLNCVADPFTLVGRTLIVRYRYAMLTCGGQGEPAYKVFRPSLDRIFGNGEAARLVSALDAGLYNPHAEMPQETFDALHAINDIKRGTL